MGEVRVTVAKTAGFCFGVARAVQMCERLISDGIPSVTLGPVINNPQVVKELERRGVKAVISPGEAKQNETVVIRSHGVGPHIYEELERLSLKYIDASCIDVLKIHDIVKKGAEKGRITLIAGDRDHPEVIGIAGYAGNNCHIFSSVMELQQEIFPKTGDLPVIMVAQTTFNLIQYYMLIEAAKELYSDIEVHDTVCSAMQKRQLEAESLCTGSELCIVIGGKQSSNSKKLFEICSSLTISYLIEDKDELNASMFKGKSKIAVTAGASTPTAVIEEVLSRMDELIRDNGDEIIESKENELDKETVVSPVDNESEPVDEVADDPAKTSEERVPESLQVTDEADELTNEDELPQPDTVIPEPEKEEQSQEPSNTESEASEEEAVVIGVSEAETVIEQEEVEQQTASSDQNEAADEESVSGSEEEFNFETALEGSLRPVRRNQRVSGIVTQIRPNEVVVDIGSKQTGIIPVEELSDDTSKKPEEIVSIGERVNLFVINTNDVEGITTLSKKRVDSSDGMNVIANAFEQDGIVDAFVVDVVEKGLIAIVKGTRVFIPASQATARPGEKFDSLLRTNVKIKILEVNPSRKRIIGSIRAVAQQEAERKREEFWKTVEVDKEYTGTVKSLTNYGAFVDLGGVDGMVHVSELSWQRVRNPSEVVSVGDEITVYIRSADHEKKRISLGYRREENDPFKLFISEYKVDDIFEATIVSLTQFGAFARIMPGVDGLIHISEISSDHIAKVSDVLAVGDKVSVKLLDVNADKKRISLSMRYEGAPEVEIKAAGIKKDNSEQDLPLAEVKEEEPPYTIEQPEQQPISDVSSESEAEEVVGNDLDETDVMKSEQENEEPSESSTVETDSEEE